MSAADTSAPENDFKFEDEHKTFTTVYHDHNEEVTAVQRRRSVRKNRISLKDMRDKGQILSDELVIPNRTIDSNVRVEKPPYTKYIEQPSTILSFEDPSYPDQNLQPLAVWHAGIARFGNWKLPHFFAHDALLLHGAAYMEVVYNPDVPSASTREYIRREDLIFPKSTRNLQACGRVYRRYETTKASLTKLSQKYKFDPAQVQKIRNLTKNSTSAIEIFKAFLRDENGVIYVAWFAHTQYACTSWLKEPVKFQIGLFDDVNGVPTPRDVTNFPIFVFPYHIEEDEEILDVQGRAALDIHTQDCLTALWSGTTNAVTRASRFFPTRKPPQPGQEIPRSTEAPVMKHGVIMDGDIDVFQPSWPNAIAISAAQTLSAQKAQEIGATDYAAGNRQDTRKTATELRMAQAQADDLSGPNVALYSMCMLEMETLGWEIIKSGILVEKLLNVPPDQRKFKFPQSIPVNIILSPTLNVAMAADAQVVRRAQRQSRFLEHWPIVQNTPYAIPYLETFLQETFPEEFPLWKQSIGESNQQMQSMSEMLKMAVQYLSQMPPQAIPAEQQQQFVAFLNQVDQMTKQEEGNAPQP